MCVCFGIQGYNSNIAAYRNKDNNFPKFFPKIVCIGIIFYLTLTAWNNFIPSSVNSTGDRMNSFLVRETVSRDTRHINGVPM